MASNIEIPREFEGKPTRYDLFDGYRQLGKLGKAAYIAGAALAPFTGVTLAVPLIIEFVSYNHSVENRKKAEKYYEAQQASVPSTTVQGRAPSIEHAPDLNPSVEHGTRFQDHLKAREASLSQVSGRT